VALFAGKHKLATQIMEDGQSLYKGEKVMKWFRFGYTFFEKARVGYDFARHVEDVYTLRIDFIGIDEGKYLLRRLVI
jgi:hypothetical protein